MLSRIDVAHHVGGGGGRDEGRGAPLGAPNSPEAIFLILLFLLVSAMCPANLQEGMSLQSLCGNDLSARVNCCPRRVCCRPRAGGVRGHLAIERQPEVAVCQRCRSTYLWWRSRRPPPLKNPRHDRLRGACQAEGLWPKAVPIGRLGRRGRGAGGGRPRNGGSGLRGEPAAATPMCRWARPVGRRTGEGCTGGCR